MAYQAKKQFLDADRVLFAFRQAPSIFAKQLEIWERKERKSFLGGPVKGGSGDGKGFRGKLLNKKLVGRPGSWSPAVAGQFKSYMQGRGTLGVKVTMGIVQDNPLTKGLELLEKGGTISSDKYMPVPVYRNLAQVGVVRDAYGAFKERSEAGQLTGINQGNRMLWFYNRNGHRLLLFVGKKQMKVKKQFTFTRAWQQREPSVIRRGQLAADKATKQVEKMIKEGTLT
jgi:hypothetical protein